VPPPPGPPPPPVKPEAKQAMSFGQVMVSMVPMHAIWHMRVVPPKPPDAGQVYVAPLGASPLQSESIVQILLQKPWPPPAAGMWQAKPLLHSP